MKYKCWTINVFLWLKWQKFAFYLWRITCTICSKHGFIYAGVTYKNFNISKIRIIFIWFLLLCQTVKKCNWIKYSNTRIVGRWLPYRADSWLLFVIAVPESDHFKAHRLLKKTQKLISVIFIFLTQHTYLSCNVIFHNRVEHFLRRQSKGLFICTSPSWFSLTSSI